MHQMEPGSRIKAEAQSNRFQASKDGYHVRMWLAEPQQSVQTPKGSNSRVLKVVLEKETMEIYKRQIDESYIENQKELSFFIKTPQDLLEYLRLVFSKKATIDHEGSIIFCIDVQSISKSYTFLITTSLQPLTQVDVANKRINKLEKQLNEEVKLRTQAQKEISNLKRSLAQIQLVVKTMEKRLQENNLKVKVRATNTDLIVQSLVWRGVLAGQLFKQRQSNKNSQRGQLAQSYAQHFASVSKVQSLLQYPDHCRFVSEFKFEDNRVKNFLKKTDTNNWRTFVCSRPIEESCTYHIDLHTLTQKCLSLGVGDKEMVGCKNVCKANFLNYSFDKNCVWESGMKRDATNQINSKSHLKVRISFKAYKVEWYSDGVKICEGSIPHFMRHQPLYFMLYFYYENDCMTFWVD